MSSQQQEEIEVEDEVEVEVEDDWNLPLDFHLFAEHEHCKVYFPNSSNSTNNSTTTTTKNTKNTKNNSNTNTSNNNNSTSTSNSSTYCDFFTVACVRELTPIDMISLSNGEHDATGHCVWMGAFLLVACIHEIAPFCTNGRRRIIELGCGTGIGGLALLLSSFLQAPSAAASKQQQQQQHHPCQVTFTDADPAVLNVCRRNCELNHCYSVDHDDHNEEITTTPTNSSSERKKTNKHRCEVLELKWGDVVPEHIAGSFDTVLATDVLYDIGLLPPLFQTAAAVSTIKGSYFILSHVPRACYTSITNPPVENLERHIIEQAKAYGFQLETIIRPISDDNKEGGDASSSTILLRTPLPKDAINNTSLADMRDVGAAILVFRKD